MIKKKKPKAELTYLAFFEAIEQQKGTFYCEPYCSSYSSYLSKQLDDDDDDDGGTHLFSHRPGDCRGGQRTKHTAVP